MSPTCLLPPVIALVFSPLLLGVINRTKARFAGRAGAPLHQPYHDLLKLLRKGAVYSRTTTWLFRAGPVVGLGAMLAASALVPFGGLGAPLAFEGDLLVLAGLLALARFVTVNAALDTGSSFEGMGASREVQFSALAEPALFLGLASMARETGAVSLGAIFASLSAHPWAESGLAPLLAAVALAIVFLAENARIPVDDPNTHLELTMIHEVMVLDHSGPDFALIQYGAALKLWLLGSLVVGMLLPVGPGSAPAGVALAGGGMIALAVLTGVVESVMARLRLLRVPQLLVGAGALSSLALVLAFV
ncbi:MAG: NADH-quinone oxidoreductase subunit H [Planctomycetes bacterium]|nr:NADH-quinone oxidoreductase subunit H [Planctomycetota bacterium]